MNRKAWHAAIHRVAKSRTRLKRPSSSSSSSRQMKLPKRGNGEEVTSFGRIRKDFKNLGEEFGMDIEEQ